MSSQRRVHRRAAAALALLVAGHLPSAALAQPRYVCGADYNDASLRCTVNPTCPTGDGCPADQPVCFALERANCFSPPPTGMPTTGTPTGSPKPTPAPTPAPRQVCGLTYGAALAGCLTNPACFRGDGCPAGEACFNIPFFMCVSDAPTAAPTPAPRVCGRNVADAEGHCPDPARACAAGCGGGEACWTVAADRCGATAGPSPGPTLRPTDPLVPRVCGRDGADAEVNCPDAGQRCPLGTECGRGQACFTVAEERCGGGPAEEEEEEETDDDDGEEGAPPVVVVDPVVEVVEPTEWQVCGADYNDATNNCRENQQCPTGDSCPMGTACYSIPLSLCPEATPPPTPAPAVATPRPTRAPTLPPATARPVTGAPVAAPEWSFVCGRDYGDAATHVCDNQDCASGEGCDNDDICYSFPYRDCGGAEEADAAPSEPSTWTGRVCGADYNDAVMNCRANPQCPLGDACPAGTSCFDIPASLCPEEDIAPPPPAVVATPRPTLRPTLDPTPRPTPRPSPAPTRAATPPPTAARSSGAPAAAPEWIFVCGRDYGDAATNVCTNQNCASGEGCANGDICYSIANRACGEEDAANTPSSSSSIEETTQPATSPVTPALSDPPTTRAPSTRDPTASPVFNVFFCGATYALAEGNCWTAEPCPSGTGCSVPGEACFGIGLPRCLSPAPTDSPTGPGPRPTDSPTTSAAPTYPPTVTPAPVSLAPSRAPVVNTNFCGADYGDAVNGCSEATACPNMGCPDGLMCYTGITRCAAMEGPDGDKELGSTPSLIFPSASLTYPATPSGGAPVTIPTTPGSRPTGLTASAPGQAAGPAPQALPTSWLNDVGANGAAALPVNLRYCGLNLQDAHDRCGVNTPCPDGRSDNCLTGQTCFPIPAVCMAGVFPTPPTAPGGVAPPADAVTPSLVTPTPTVLPTASTMGFDSTATQFCGADYFDALDNCYMHRPCPNGTPEECPKGQGCYPGITNCQTPPPSIEATGLPTQEQLAASSSRGEPVSAGSAATVPPTMSPGQGEIPGWDWVIQPSSSSRRTGLLLQSLVVAGAMFGLVLAL